MTYSTSGGGLAILAGTFVTAGLVVLLKGARKPAGPAAVPEQTDQDAKVAVAA